MPGRGAPPGGRAPVGEVRVGCIGLRSPGRNGPRGAAPGAEEDGCGRRKIGCPRTTTPGTVAGAVYTGRGPACGVIIRFTGGAGGAIGFAGAVGSVCSCAADACSS